MSTLPIRLAVVLALVSTLHAGVIVVDSSGGGDAATLDAGLALAVDGDTLLVRQGSYAELVIDGLGVNVVAAPGAAVDVVNIAVRDLAADQHVILSGLTARVSPVFIARDCAGGVWVQHATLEELVPLFAPYHAAEAQLCDNVVVHHSSLVGGSDSIDFDGGHGLHLSGDSRVASWASSFVGGEGGNLALSMYAGDGGHGLSQHGTSEAYAMGCTIQGAPGGTGGDTPSSDGAGAHVPGSALARVADVALAGSGSAPDLVGALDDLAVSARDFDADSVVQAGQSTDWVFSGEVGDTVWLLAARDPGHAFVASAAGVLALEPPLKVLGPLGVLDASGRLELNLVAPAPTAGDGSFTARMQLLVQDASGAFVLGNPMAIEVVEAGL